MEILWHCTSQKEINGLDVIIASVDDTPALEMSITTMDSKIEQSGAHAAERSSGYMPATRESERQSQKMIKLAFTSYFTVPGFISRAASLRKVGAWEPPALPTRKSLKAVTDQHLKFTRFKKENVYNSHLRSDYKTKTVWTMAC